MILVSVFLFVAYGLFYRYFRGNLERVLKRRICAVCFAASSTWITLLGFSFFGFYTDKIILAIFLGETVVGVSYLSDSFVKRYRLSFSEEILRAAIIVFGTLGAYWFLETGEFYGLLMVFLLLAFGFLAFEPVSKEDVSDGESRKENLTFIREKLKDCC